MTDVTYYQEDYMNLYDKYIIETELCWKKYQVQDCFVSNPRVSVWHAEIDIRGSTYNKHYRKMVKAFTKSYIANSKTKEEL